MKTMLISKKGPQAQNCQAILIRQKALANKAHLKGGA
jgi:hypothetical protein